MTIDVKIMLAIAITCTSLGLAVGVLVQSSADATATDTRNIRAIKADVVRIKDRIGNPGARPAIIGGVAGEIRSIRCILGPNATPCFDPIPDFDVISRLSKIEADLRTIKSRVGP